MVQNLKKENDIEIYDLCIIGAGISGLNALFAATKYLNKESKVLLVEKRSKAGGMWNNVYDNVRLHQPYQTFTAGNIAWDLKKDISHLATKTEVLSHLNLCLEKLSKLVSLEVRFGCTFIESEEKEMNNGFIVVSTFERDGKEFNISSKKLIKSIGLNIQAKKPIKTTSQKVNSITQEGIQEKIEEIKTSKKTIYIIGGGKSGTDAAKYILENCPDSNVHLLIGRGVLFLDRSVFFPKGIKRHYGGVMVTDWFYNISTKFNGKNAIETMEYLKSGPNLKLTDKVSSTLYAFLSPQELEFIKKGVSSITNDHLVDVLDNKDNISLKLKSGKTIESEAGTWIINCTSYILGTRAPYDPYISKHGTTVSINKSSTVFLTTFSSFFLTHLLYSGKLRQTPFFEIDLDELLGKHKEAFGPITSQQLLYNVLLMVDALPMAVLNEWGPIFDKWYPAYRQLYTFIKLQIRKKKFLEHAKKSLETAQQHYGIRCGILKTE